MFITPFTPLFVFDIETDGLLDTVTKVYCLSFSKIVNKQVVETGTITTKEQIVDFFKQKGYFIGHNIVRYDIPALEMIFNIDLSLLPLVDTLGLSWYLYPYRKSHGLEDYGEDYGIPKPKVEDWKNLPLEVYIKRCEEDVKINVRLFLDQLNYLIELYETYENVTGIGNYLTFKMDCLRDQEYVGITVDLPYCEEQLEILTNLFEEKTKELSEAMPEHLGKVLKQRPSKLYKKDGTLNHWGDKWFNYLRENNLPLHIETVREEPNPASPTQLKEWLFLLGWVPITFKESKSTGEAVPQVSLPFGQGLCPSIKEMFEEHPVLEELDKYYTIRHRIGLFKGFLEKEKNGKVYATAHGFTNTLRLTHSKPIANLPKPENYYGKEVRGCLTIPDEDHIMIGSDVSALEDSTKQHYIYYFDPEYVKDMRVPGFDPHIDIGVLSGLLSKEDEEFYRRVNNLSKEEFENLSVEDLFRFNAIKKVRGTAKTVNFACVYGAGGPKVAETAKISLEEGYEFHKIYWKRNKAVKEVAAACTVKTVRNQTWLYNPVSRFWMFLKEDKDRFSTLNQSTGAFVFDCWLREVRRALKTVNIFVCLQYHDELLISCPKSFRRTVINVLQDSMEKVNDMLRLNVPISISVDVGNNYAECH